MLRSVTGVVAMAKPVALLLSVALLAAPAGRAETVVVRADWEKARTLLTQGEFRPRIAVELNSPKRVMVTKGTFHDRTRKEVELKPSKWVKGKLVETTDVGLQLVYRSEEISFPRENIRRIRLVPLKAEHKKNRRVGLSGGIPAGIGAGFLVIAALCRGDCDADAGPAIFSIWIGITMAVTYVFYTIGKRADRGVVVVELGENTANNPPVTAQALGPSAQ